MHCHMQPPTRPYFFGSSKQEYSSTSQVKSIPPRGNMKASRSAYHRGLPGGGGLWVYMRLLGYQQN